MRGQRWNLCPVCALRCMATSATHQNQCTTVYETAMVDGLGGAEYSLTDMSKYIGFYFRPRSPRATYVYLFQPDHLVTACPITTVRDTTADLIKVYMLPPLERVG